METTGNGTTVQNPNFAAFNVEKAHSFIREHNAKLAVVIPGYRHSVIQYRVIKSKADSGIIKPTKLVTVPQLEMPAYFTKLACFIDASSSPEDRAQNAEATALQSVLLSTLEDAQDSVIREIVDAGKSSTVEWSDITLEKVIQFLTTARVSARLTREAIEAWFTVQPMQDAIAERAAELHNEKQQKGIVDGFTLSQRVTDLAGRYKQLLGGLAAPVPTLKQNESEACESIIKRSKMDDDMSRSLLGKLNDMLRPKVTRDGDL